MYCHINLWPAKCKVYQMSELKELMEEFDFEQWLDTEGSRIVVAQGLQRGVKSTSVNVRAAKVVSGRFTQPDYWPWQVFRR